MKRGSFVLFASWIAAHAVVAGAQSPFSGTWVGTQSVTGSDTCTCSGSSCGPSTTATCTLSQPWTGVVDAQGNLSITLGAGTEVCNPGNATVPVPPSGPTAGGQVPTSGSLAVAPVSQTVTVQGDTTTVTCGGYTMQFASSGVSSNFSCSTNDVNTASGNTITCNTQAQYMLSASSTGSSGGTVLVPPKVIFPITVSSNITTANAMATAQVSPPTALQGTSGSVFVFAQARLSSLHLAPTEQKDGGTPDPCVLAQVNSSGQLVPASASSLQPYTTGVLSAQSQSVAVLNNVPTPGIAGASFLVGYGSNSSSMLSNGNYEGAVSVNGTSPCSTALLAQASPNSPGGLSGLWWNASESGWGVAFTQRRNIVFGAWYTYDSAGKPKWYVASNCTLPSGVTGTSGTCTGSLYQVAGPTFFTGAFNPALVNVATVGNLTIAFQDANTATMTYTVNGQGRTVPIIRQVFQSGTTPLAVDYTDLWWNPNESGWGMEITQQFGVMFLAWYVYDSGGNPVWYVAPDCVVVGSSCTGSVYSTTGPPLGPSFNASQVHATAVGSITATFQDANNGTITYTVNGTSGTKQITRQTF